MSCQPLPGGGFICGRRESRQPCQSVGCDRPHVALCDFPLEGAAKGKTCDRKMCASHRGKVGPDRDYCPAHLALAKAKQGELFGGSK